MLHGIYELNIYRENHNFTYKFIYFMNLFNLFIYFKLFK
jgi:hypothetical protein